jgi:hypothetical protein
MSKGRDADWRALALQDALLKFWGGLHRDSISAISLPVVGGGGRVQSCSRPDGANEMSSGAAVCVCVFHQCYASPHGVSQMADVTAQPVLDLLGGRMTGTQSSVTVTHDHHRAMWRAMSIREFEVALRCCCRTCLRATDNRLRFPMFNCISNSMAALQ